MPGWFLALSIQWKLQLGFFLVTMITIVVNRLEGYAELGKFIEIARSSGVSETIVRQLDARLDSYVWRRCGSRVWNSSSCSSSFRCSPSSFRGPSKIWWVPTYERHETIDVANHEKRRSPRITSHLRVLVQQQGKTYETICRDLSMTGLRLALKKRLADSVPAHLSGFLPYDNLAEYEQHGRSTSPPALRGNGRRTAAIFPASNSCIPPRSRRACCKSAFTTSTVNPVSTVPGRRNMRHETPFPGGLLRMP